MQPIFEDFNSELEKFKRRHGVHHVIAFSGGADSEIPGIDSSEPIQEKYKYIQKEREVRIVREALNILKDFRIAVLSGGTKYGFPKTAVEIAKELGLLTIGVFPFTALAKKQVLEELDLPLCVKPCFGESSWGDESSVFAKLLDAVIVFGGGAGTLIEVAHILKMNESLHKYDKPVKRILPISGTGGVADGLHFVWGKQLIKQISLPDSPIYSGSEAALTILGKYLDLTTRDS